MELRSPFIVFAVALTIIGLAMLMTIHHHFPAQYAALFLFAMGVNTTGPLITCWYVMNLRGHMERSVGPAWAISFGNCGGIIATFTFLATDAPYYHMGSSLCMGMVALGSVAAAVYGLLLWKDNKRARMVAEDKQGLLCYSF